MRIIAGSKNRMPLLPPRQDTTRPITDRVKESVFAILEPRLSQKNVLDLFCGTGSLGLEALSRGADHALMVEKDRDAFQRLKKNIAKLEFNDSTTAIQTDAFRYVDARLIKFNENKQRDRPINLAFVDPPYALSRLTSHGSKLGILLINLSRQIEPRAVVLVRHERRIDLLPKYGQLHASDRREYGSMALTFLENIGAP